MAEATLCVDRKARRVDRATLEMVPVPEPEGRWYPIGHSQVLDMVMDCMGRYGFQVEKQELALSNDDRQFFGTLDVRSEIADGVSLAVGVRNSIDKSLSAAMVFGDRVFVCSNLCWSGSVGLSRKHTTNAVEDLNVRIPQIVAGLPRYAAVAAERIRALQCQVLDPQQASHVMLRAAQRGVIGWSLLKRLAEEWDKPSVPELTRGTKWSMLNALTHVAKQRQAERPVDAARMTMRFQEMLIAA